MVSDFQKNDYNWCKNGVFEKINEKYSQKISKNQIISKRDL